MSDLGRTVTEVRDGESRLAQQARELGRENALLLSAAAGAQLLAMSALYLLPEALNASWWAALLSALPACFLFFLGRAVGRALPRGEKPSLAHR
ncbi:MAG: hypothetical protein IJS53_02545, partial [Clostridia bacterium]|nr:hypothetical protein [Clostridia bacterium]